MSELNAVKANTVKRDQLQKTEAQATQARVSTNPATAVEQHYHIQRRTAQVRMLNATIVGRRDTSRIPASPRREKRTWGN